MKLPLKARMTPGLFESLYLREMEFETNLFTINTGKE